MANFNKSFNFRNGVQVDNDNFIVNSNGLVGIGTTIPRDYILNVYGNTRITGIVTASNLYVTNSVTEGISTVGFLSATNIKVGGAVTATTFYGSASGLTEIYAIAVDGWHVSGGFISTTSNVGIGTTLPSGNLQIGVGVTINNNGNATYSGILTAYAFSGFGTDITGINASNISSGTLSNSRLPSNINISGVVTAYAFSGFGTDITGINASNISSGTISNSRLPQSINVTGIITSYSFSGFGTDITGINASNISSGTISNSRLPQSINVSGVITASNFYGIASTAQTLTGNPNISVTDIFTSGNINVGNGGNSFTVLSNGNVGIGTSLPTSELQIRKSSGSLLEVVSNGGEARISVGQSIGVGNSSFVLRFGNSTGVLDVINNDVGDVKTIIHAGTGAGSTGNFKWVYGQTNAERMTLTYDGKLGINNISPTHTLSVGGATTITGNVYVNSNLTVGGNITGNINYPSIIDGTNLNNTSGITTLSQLKVSNNVNFDGTTFVGLGTAVGIGTTISETNYGLTVKNNLSANFINVIEGIDTNTGFVTSTTVTATAGFKSNVLSSNSVQIDVYSSPNRIVFTVLGIGSTTLNLF
jgi:hypothetical protein